MPFESPSFILLLWLFIITTLPINQVVSSYVVFVPPNNIILSSTILRRVGRPTYVPTKLLRHDILWNKDDTFSTTQQRTMMNDISKVTTPRSYKSSLTRTSTTRLYYGTVDNEIWIQLGISLILSTATDTFFEQIFIGVYRYNRIMIQNNKMKGNITYASDKDADEAFESTLWYSGVNSITRAAQIATVFLSVDVLQTITGFQIVPPIFNNALQDGSVVPLSSAGISVAFITWVALTASTIKRTIFLQSVSGTELGRVILYDRLLDFLIFTAAIAVSLDALNIDLGMGAMSLLAGSGASALLFSLASKDLAQQIVGGFIVQAWDAFVAGEIIRLEDGTEGKVQRVGLVDTEIIQTDDVVIKIPNSQLTKIRIANLSRISTCQVQQTIYFKLSDIDIITNFVLPDIKNEIQRQCPELITNGTKPFTVAISSLLQNNTIEVKIDCHFNIPYTSSKATENKQTVLVAINNAVRKHKIELL